MNDVTILAPLPTGEAPVLLRGADLADDGETYDQLHLVAVRFDLCDRQQPGVCPDAEDGRMRLVFQPIADQGAFDAGFHAFYAIRNAEIAPAVAALRDLATTVAGPRTGALRPSPALTASTSDAYAVKLRAFVKRFGGESRIVRLTINAQPQTLAQIQWALRGVEKKDGVFVEMAIAGGAATSERVILAGRPGYEVTPATDHPAGLAGAMTQSMFDAADPTKRREYLAALAAVDNPLTHSAETVACVACHVSTVLTAARAAGAGIDPVSLPERYTSTRDLSVAAGKSRETERTLRALGYLGKDPMISQRVVNDTAQVLSEIERRYPGP